MRALVAVALAVLWTVGCSTPLEPAPEIGVPEGYRAEVYARGLTHPSAMAFGPDGRLYVTEDVGRLVSVSRGSMVPRVLLEQLATPLGLLWLGRTLYVSEQGRVERFGLESDRLAERAVVLPNLPFGLHQQNTLVAGPDGRLYLGNGSTCNACSEEDPRSATILSFRPDGSDLRVVATGLRNPFGLAFRPGTEELYASVNGRDDLPNVQGQEPAEVLVRVEEGADYGWPDCWPSPPPTSRPTRPRTRSPSPRTAPSRPTGSSSRSGASTSPTRAGAAGSTSSNFRPAGFVPSRRGSGTRSLSRSTRRAPCSSPTGSAA